MRFVGVIVFRFDEPRLAISANALNPSTEMVITGNVLVVLVAVKFTPRNPDKVGCSASFVRQKQQIVVGIMIVFLEGSCCDDSRTTFVGQHPTSDASHKHKVTEDFVNI